LFSYQHFFAAEDFTLKEIRIALEVNDNFNDQAFDNRESHWTSKTKCKKFCIFNFSFMDVVCCFSLLSHQKNEKKMK
jgi:hypothetical protein